MYYYASEWLPTVVEARSRIINNNTGGEEFRPVDDNSKLFLVPYHHQLTEFLLKHVVSRLDGVGGWEWDLRHVALTAAMFFAIIKLSFNKKRGICWYEGCHAMIQSVGAITCMYLDYAIWDARRTLAAADNDASQTSSIYASSPYRDPDLVCGGPTTSLHRLLPAILMGYAMVDFVDAMMTMFSYDFVLHGFGAFVATYYYSVSYNKSHLLTPFLLMEVSTVFLSLVRADFFNVAASFANQLAFAFTFFVFRIILSPWMWFNMVSTMYENRRSSACLPSPLFFPASLLMGVCFHALNGYWFYRILRKARRKILGIEGVQANNELETATASETENGRGDVSRSSSASTVATASSFDSRSGPRKGKNRRKKEE